MGRVLNSVNKNVYHYKATIYDNDRNIIGEDLFLTLNDVAKRFNVSKRLCGYQILKDDIHSKGKLKNIRIERIRKKI